MNYRRWQNLSFLEQMANIGGEVQRATNWQEKNRSRLGRNAFVRGLDLIDLTLDIVKSAARLKELARTRELLVDHFMGENLYRTSAESWRRYFMPYAVASRQNR